MIDRPNFLFISTHDLNPDLGTYDGVWPNAGQAPTPRLDRLAAEGERFDQAFAAAPVCSPSRAAIFTGRYPTSIGTMHMRSRPIVPADVELFTQALRRAGYFTTNNWFTDMNLDVPPTAFDDCSDTAHWRDRPDPSMPFFAAFHSAITHESRIHATGETLEDMLPHVPAANRVRPVDVRLPPYHPDTPEFRTAWSTYLNLITEMDDWVGTLLDQLEDDGLADRTVVIFWSDHGAGLPGAKRWASEAGLRVPLIVRWPGRIAPGTVRTDPVELQDLAPTVLSLASVTDHAPVDGAELYAPDGSPRHARDRAFAARDRMVDEHDASRTVRDSRYRYVRHIHPDRPWMQHAHYPDSFPTWKALRSLSYREAQQVGDGRVPSLLTPEQRRLIAPTKDAEELYDISSDPHQTTNLLGRPELAAKTDELRNALDEWLIRTGDLGLRDEEALLTQWRPDGASPQTAPPEVTAVDGAFVAESNEPGASIGWSREEPSERPPLALEIRMGPRMTFAQRWELYTGPVTAAEGPVRFRAWRLGYEPSDVIVASETDAHDTRRAAMGER